MSFSIRHYMGPYIEIVGDGVSTALIKLGYDTKNFPEDFYDRLCDRGTFNESNRVVLMTNSSKVKVESFWWNEEKMFQEGLLFEIPSDSERERQIELMELEYSDLISFLKSNIVGEVCIKYGLVGHSS